MLASVYFCVDFFGGQGGGNLLRSFCGLIIINDHIFSECSVCGCFKMCILFVAYKVLYISIKLSLLIVI